MQRLDRLSVSEPTLCDQRQIRKLFVLLGTDGAQSVIKEGLGALAGALSLCEAALVAREKEPLRDAVQLVAQSSAQLGMQSLLVACHANLDALAQGEWIAISATGARVLRLGDQSLIDYGLLCGGAD